MITQFYTLSGDNRPHKFAGFDFTSCFRSVVIGVLKKTAENVADNGFGSNFSGASFWPQHRLVSLLLNETQKRFRLMLSPMSAATVTKCFFNISETTRASNFKMYHHLADDSFCILTRNDKTSYFRSAANRIIVFIWGHVRVAISQ